MKGTITKTEKGTSLKGTNSIKIFTFVTITMMIDHKTG